MIFNNASLLILVFLAGMITSCDANLSTDLLPEYLTIFIINNQDKPISTSHAVNAGGPTPIWGADGPGTVSVAETVSFAVPTGWGGNVAIVDAFANDSITPLPETGDNSLIEGSFVVSSNDLVAVADIDVSYVNGFTNAITCSCSGVVVAGCNLPLWTMGPCFDNNGAGACVNPLRNDTVATAALPFFAPCQGAAYTFPNDNAANSWGQCQNGLIICCVGEECAPNPNQPVQN